MKNFQKDTEISGGTESHPNYVEIGEYKCIKCNIEAVEIGRKKRFSSIRDERGTLNTDWEEVTIKCPKCKTKEKYDTYHHESDGSFYSMSQPDG